MFIPPRFIIVKHIVSLLFLITGSIILAILFFTYAPDAIFIAFFLTVILFLIMTLIAWKFKEYISSKVTLLLVVVFLGMIIIEGIVLWFFPNSIINTIVILVVLMIICYLLLVKTKRMIENAKNCKEPDYVQEGIGLLLSFQNILLQILQLRR
jgi:FtsH-binding integral membrane protein